MTREKLGLEALLARKGRPPTSVIAGGLVLRHGPRQQNLKTLILPPFHLLAFFTVAPMMDDLQKEILKEVNTLIPDINQERAKALVLYITNEDVGVRSLERLYDLPLEEIASKVPMCDANKLHREWKQKFG